LSAALGVRDETSCGITLIELLIVVALILIIAAIAVPSLTQAKINANETSAAASIRAINTAELSYQAAYGGYADSLANLGGAEPCAKSAATACLLDQSLAGGAKSGYNLWRLAVILGMEANTTYVAGRHRWCSTAPANDCFARRRRT